MSLHIYGTKCIYICMQHFRSSKMYSEVGKREVQIWRTFRHHGAFWRWQKQPPERSVRLQVNKQLNVTMRASITTYYDDRLRVSDNKYLRKVLQLGQTKLQESRQNCVRGGGRSLIRTALRIILLEVKLPLCSPLRYTREFSYGPTAS